MKRSMRLIFVLTACVLLAASVAVAQKKVDGLQDLVGRGRSAAAGQLEDRGYKHAGTEETDDDLYTYWVEPGSKDCVEVHTVEGRTNAVVYTSAANCESEKKSKESHENKWPDHYSTEPGEEAFDTVCGVVSGGKTKRMKCHLRNESCGGSGQCRTHLTFSDNKLTLTWHGGGEVTVKAKGVEAEKSKTSTENGQTRFDFGGNTYFVYRHRDDAKHELAKLK